MKKTNSQKGITLVALIITIIVLLILAVVAIRAVQGDGIIRHAENARDNYAVAQDSEAAMLDDYITEIEKKLGTNLEKITMTEAQSDEMLSKEINSMTYDIFGNRITIPAGFKILVDDTTGYTETNLNVTKGIVITDGTNEFTWIPVGTVYTNAEKTESKTITLGRYKVNYVDVPNGTDFEIELVQKAENYATQIAIQYGSIDAIENTQINHDSKYKNAIAKDIGAFCINTMSNKGYYIGRYPGGVENYDANKTITNNDNNILNWTGYIAEEGKNLKLVCNSEAQKWNYITQNKASEVCQNMYVDSKVFSTDLANSYAYDTAVYFLDVFGNFTDLDEFWGGTFPYGSKGVMVCNVAQLGHSDPEYSTETSVCDGGADYCFVQRGQVPGSTANLSYGDDFKVDDRGAVSVNYWLSHICFRPIIYFN